jgi:hypothetical protein
MGGVLAGRGSKTSLELTYDIIAIIDTYLKTNEKLQALTTWKSVAPAFAVSL